MKNGTCPRCTSTEIYRTDFAPLQAGDSLVRLYNPAGNNFPIEVHLCAACGYMEMGVAASHTTRLPDLVKSDKWKKVG